MRLRLDQGLGRLKLARRIAFLVGPEAIQRYENEKVQPRYEVVRELAHALKCDVSDLTEVVEVPDAEV